MHENNKAQASYKLLETSVPDEEQPETKYSMLLENIGK